MTDKNAFAGIGGRLRIACLLFAVLLVFGFASCSGNVDYRQKTLDSLVRIKDDADKFDAYFIDVKYDYDLDSVISRCESNDLSCLRTAYEDATQSYDFTATLALLVQDYQNRGNMSSFACSAFAKQMGSNHVMGRNYDLGASDSSMLLVHCKPKGGYESIGIACLSHLYDDEPLKSKINSKIALMAPYACIDGINEKGVSVCTLMVDAKDLKQDTGKPVLYLPFFVRLVLDRAATTSEAVEIIKQYDIFGALQDLAPDYVIDYHFYVSDASGDARVIEFDPDDEHRATVATASEYVTNFYVMENDDPDGKDYDGYGQERYTALKDTFDAASEATEEAGWNALHNAWQNSTIWSFMANNTTKEFVVEYHKDSDNRLVFRDFKLVN